MKYNGKSKLEMLTVKTAGTYEMSKLTGGHCHNFGGDSGRVTVGPPDNN